MQFRAGVPAVSRTVPALQFIAEHEQISERMRLHPERSLCVFIFIKRYGEFVETVVKQYRCQCIHMHFIQRIDAERVYGLPEKAGRAEVGVVHKVPELIRGYRFVVDSFMKIFFCHIKWLTEFVCDTESKEFLGR